MAKLSKDEILDGIKEMSILELNDLVKALEEEFGIDLNAYAAAPATAASDAPAEATTKTVVLKSAGGNKIAVIKIIKEVTGLGLVDAKAVADNGGNIKENIPAEEAEQLKAQLEEAGAEVELA